MKYIKLIFVFCVALLMQFCGNDNHTHGPADGHDAAHQDHAAMDEEPNVVGLSEAQIKAIDLKLGVIEKKHPNRNRVFRQKRSNTCYDCQSSIHPNPRRIPEHFEQNNIW